MGIPRPVARERRHQPPRLMSSAIAASVVLVWLLALLLRSESPLISPLKMFTSSTVWPRSSPRTAARRPCALDAEIFKLRAKAAYFSQKALYSLYL